MEIGFLESLIRMLDDSSLDTLEIRRGGTRLRLSKSPDGIAAANPVVHAPAAPATTVVPTSAAAESTAAPAASKAAPPAASASAIEVTSPMVGTFYRAPSPEADPYVEVGSEVAAGDVLCVIEAMKLMNELECEGAGRIVEICVDNAEPVEFGQLLFRLEPS
ncbi:MAG: acetyl-CoA carboxylase biotin carboxyl carrier protein [Gemmatimonadetes bacterium]|nr:acetyl-CoA carboxylase biotin carboxyl carrier protein [Gemmatimonadota bacterium]MCY3942583.1 acetyl-CoA carboxylase biotin carboxyl carrier protein [Gemmatimonadota bacterium]